MALFPRPVLPLAGKLRPSVPHTGRDPSLNCIGTDIILSMWESRGGVLGLRRKAGCDDRAGSEEGRVSGGAGEARAEQGEGTGPAAHAGKDTLRRRLDLIDRVEHLRV